MATILNTAQDSEFHVQKIYIIIRYITVLSKTVFFIITFDKTIVRETVINIESFLIYIYIYISSSSLSRRANSTDIPDPLLPPLPIVYYFQLVFRVTSRFGTKLLYVGSSWSSCLCSSMWRDPQEHIPYELVPTCAAVFRMSGSANFDSFSWWVVGGLTAAALWGAASMTCFNIAHSILV